MITDRLTKIIFASCVSEKSARIKVDRQYVFRVAMSASKEDVAQAVKFLFNVDVEKVRISRVPGKKCSFKNIAGKKQDWKKAYVTVQEGQTINLGES